MKLVKSQNQFEVFRVWNANEHMTVMVAQHRIPGGQLREQKMEIELIITSSLGTFAHTWPSCGMPLAGKKGPVSWVRWLYQTDLDYFLKKITGYKHTIDHPEGTWKAFQEVIEQEKESRMVDPAHIEEAEEALTCVDPTHAEDIDVTSHVIITEMSNTKLFADSYWEYGEKQIDPILIRFWEVLWRPFITELYETHFEKELA